MHTSFFNHLADNFKSLSILIFGCAMLFLFFQKPDIQSKDDLTKIEGKLVRYSFTHERGYRNTLRKYYLWLDNYPCTFQIKANFIPFFVKSSFERNVQAGQLIELTIPKNSQPDIIKPNEKVFIMSLSDSRIDYLRHQSTTENHNNNFELYMAIAAFTIALIVFVYQNSGFNKRPGRSEI